MNQGRSLNPQIVHDVAAHLFWTLAEAVGVAGANEAVVDSAGQCLLDQPFTTGVLCQYGIETLPSDDQREFDSAIAAEAERFAVKGENMNGVIYADDAQIGKSPSAQHVQTAALKAIPSRVSANSQMIEKVGLLCIRHPLPAVVFSDTRPHGGVLEVADTSAALGFHLPMFLANVTSQQIGERLFVSTGIFHIPVPDTTHGDLWNMVIQNSTRFIGGIKFYSESGDAAVDVQW